MFEPIDAWITIPDVKAHDTTQNAELLKQQAVQKWMSVGELLGFVAVLYESVAPTRDLVQAIATLEAELCDASSNLVCFWPIG